MRLSLRSALVAALLGAVGGAAAQTLPPDPVPTKVIHNQWLIKASVGGRDGWYLLATNSPTSVRLPRSGESGPDGRVVSSDVAIGSNDGGSVKFKVTASPAVKAAGADGALGADALANFTLAIDVEEAQVAVWSDQPSLLGQRGWILLLPLIGNATQHAVTLSIDDVDKMPFGIKCNFGDTKGLAVVQLNELEGTVSDAVTAAGTTLSVTPDTLAIDNVSVGEVGPFWLLAAKAAGKLPYDAAGEVASIPLTSLPVRRIIFDGHTGTLVTEELGTDGENSLLLSRLLGVPLEIIGDTLNIRRGGALYGSDLNRFAGASVSAVAGVGADQIVAAFSDTAAARLDMLRKLVHARQQGYAIDFVQGDKPYHTTIKASP